MLSKLTAAAAAAARPSSHAVIALCQPTAFFISTMYCSLLTPVMMGGVQIIKFFFGSSFGLPEKKLDFFSFVQINPY